MKNLVKRILFSLLVAVKSHRFFHFINRKKILILMYHGVFEETMPIPCWWQLTFDEFRWQLEYVKKYHSVMHLQDVLERIQRQESLPDNVAIITFDDGYQNNYSVAYPLLKQLNLPATIFLTADFIGTDRLLWPDELFMLVLETEVPHIDLRNLGFDILELTSIHKKWETYWKLNGHLKTLEPYKKKEMIAYIRDILSVERKNTSWADNFKLLSWEQIKLMNESRLIHWGAHSCTHEILSNLDDKTLSDEIKNSCAMISKYASKILFAYPNGRKQDFDDRAKALLKQLNVLCSVTTVSGLNPCSQDPYELKRIKIGHNMSRDRFKLLCSGVVT